MRKKAPEKQKHSKGLSNSLKSLGATREREAEEGCAD